MRLSKSNASMARDICNRNDGGDERIRTADPLLAKQVLSH